MNERSVRYGIAESPLGLLLVAASARGACSVRFGASEDELVAGLREQLPSAETVRDDAGLARFRAELVRLASGLAPAQELPLDAPARGFRGRVFRALRAIPRGCTRSYAQLARELGCPRAARAVGQACAANPLALLVPCHRVVPAAGGVGGYRWGPARKRALLRAESAAAGPLREACRDPAAAR